MKYLKFSDILKPTSNASILALFLAISLGAFVRLIHPLIADFPLNDGGLFYTMTMELIEADFSLPVHTSYNLAEIPYAYPPLPFYFIAILAAIINIPVISLFRVLPAAISILSIPAFYLLSRRMLQPRNQVLFSVFAFALLPRTFEWLIMGGGVTRSFGYLFAILALHQIFLMYTLPRPKFILAATLFSSLTVLSHPETSWFVVISAGLFFLFFSKNRTGVYHSLIVAFGVLIFTTPWWITILKYHGISPLTAASQSGWHSWLIWLPLLRFDITSEPYVDLLAVLGVIGIFASLAKKRFFLPVWFLIIFTLSPRSAKIFTMIPLAMLIGIGIDQVIVPGIQNLIKNKTHPTIFQDHPNDNIFLVEDKDGNRIPKFLLFYFVFYAFFSALSTPFGAFSPLEFLTIEERSAMNWVQENTQPSSIFLVITGDNNIWKDEVSEWFPTITKRVSAATVQGSEWLPGDVELHQEQYMYLQNCATQNLDCVNSWAGENQIDFDYIYLHKLKDDLGNSFNCCYPLRNAIESSTDFRLIFDGPGATIFAQLH